MKYAIFSLFAALVLGLGSCARESGLTNVKTSETKIDHLIIKEVFYSGHATMRDLSAYGSPNAYTRYNDDQYIVIYNPSDQTLYLDSLALAINVIDPRTVFEFAPGDNFVDSYYGASSIMYFPGSGKEHPVKPGDSIVVAKYAIDHAQAFVKSLEEDEEDVKQYKGYEELLDLTKADFEWSSTKSELNNPTVPDLAAISPSRAFTVISDATGIALIRLPWSPAAFDAAAAKAAKAGAASKGKDVVLHYINVTNTDFADFWAVEIPFNKVIDCMTICPRKRMQMRPSKLDKGYLGITEDDLSTYKNKELTKVLGFSLQRKYDGRNYVDAGNTSQNFEVKRATFTRPNSTLPLRPADNISKPAPKPAQ